MPTPDEQEAARAREWAELYDRIRNVLLNFGRESHLGGADFYLVEDDWGVMQHKVEMQNLALLRPQVIAALQSQLSRFPSWSIVISVSVPDKFGVWPAMGLVVRAHEIVDGLQRQYLPPEVRNFRYAGSRPGTDRD